MDNPPSNWINYVFGVIIGLFGLLLNTYRTKIDRLEEKSAEFVTRGELREYMRSIGEARAEMHKENAVRLDHICEEIARLASRIDVLFHK